MPDSNAPLPGPGGFDTETTWAAMRAALEAGGDDPAARRRDAAAVLSADMDAARARIAASLARAPAEAREVTRAYATLTDAVVALAHRTARHMLGRDDNGPENGLAILAVGGYGRGEMAPQSDVDLLFLTRAAAQAQAEAEEIAEAMLYLLWDLRLKVGHATRSIRDTLRLAREDYTIRTSLVEARPILGDAALAEDMRRRLRRDLFAGTASDFVEAKLAERATRHEKQGGMRYVVEPNVKEGKGGLRDLQSLFWIAKYVHAVDDPADLVAHGLFTAEEYAAFERAETFLWAVRCHMHLATGRPVEQLTFDLQVEVADRLGYEDRAGRRAVEHFMQDYFRHATRVGELTRIFLVALEDAHVKTQPSLLALFRATPTVPAPYAIKHNRLTIGDPSAFMADKLNLLRLFEEALRTGTLLHPDAMRLVTANLGMIDAEMRRDPEANAIFLRMLLDYGNPERPLRRMNELGVLAAFIPEFEPIVAMMQFNMYHSYTVDEHTIQCVKALAQIERGELVEELPVASGILERGVNRRVLYVA
ncbi:MAG: DUF294 nucleotidyltransferase-like domain-containing protein, partial [Shimia sp.]